jgi:hypothetical protein
VGGCEALAPRLAPLQAARSIQVERFETRFVAQSIPHAERVFRTILGKKNYEALTAAEWVPYAQKLVDGSVTSIAVGTFVISLLPDAYDHFVVNGGGQLFAVDNSTDEVLLSGMFEIPKVAPIPVSALDGGVVSLPSRQRVMRQFALNRANYQHVSEVVLRLHVRRLAPELYTIDYDARHEVGVEGEGHRLEVIGCIEFMGTGDGREVMIDLRGRGLLRNDYEERIKQAGIRRAAPSSSIPEWGPLENCSGKPPGPHCACPTRAVEKASASGRPGTSQR